MAYSITINHQLKIIHYKHNGIIERNTIGEAWKELLSINEFTELKYNLLSDYRNGTFNFKANEINVIESFLHSIKDILSGKKNSVIVSNPNDTLVSLLFENKKSKEINFIVKTFSTESAALAFLIP